MKNIAKLLVGILFSALVMAPSYVGEMTVTGGATATTQQTVLIHLQVKT